MSAIDDRFPPIGSYGFLSDCHSAALVSFAGTVEWLCLPRFDSPSVFAALLDRGAGHFRLRPRGVIVPISRRYEPGTLVIETTWVTDTGWVVIHDALTIAEWASADGKGGRPETAHESDRSLLRTMTCIDGEVEIEMECMPRFGYGLEAAAWSGGELGEALAICADGTELRLTSDMELSLGGGAARGSLKLRENESGFCAVTWGKGGLGGPRSAPEALERLDSTEEFWRAWLRHGEFPDHPWRIHLQRSALVLKGLTYTPTGAIVAAPTTSLPETPGGERNWDYRYQLDPRLDLQPLGPAHARLRRGGARLHALHRPGLPRPARPADHVRDRRREGTDREHPRPPRRLRRGEAGADRQRRLRPAPERRLGRTAGLGLPARKSAQRHGGAGRPPARPLPGGGGDRGLAQPRSGDLGVARGAAALRLLEADDLGRGRPRRPPGPRPRLRGHRRASGRPRPTSSTPRSSSAASATASSASTTRPTRSTPRCC